MGYRDDFYTVANIVGYTAERAAGIAGLPTVYFRGGQEFGHITQNHWLNENNGREPVGSSPTYQMGNERQQDGKQVLVERNAGVLLHRSRNEFFPLNTNNPFDLPLLARAITRFPEEKLFRIFSNLIASEQGDAQEKLLETMENRQTLNAQLRRGLPALNRV